MKENCALVTKLETITDYKFNKFVMMVIGKRRIAYTPDQMKDSLTFFFNKGKYNIWISPSEVYIEVKEQYK